MLSAVHLERFFDVLFLLPRILTRLEGASRGPFDSFLTYFLSLFFYPLK